MKLPALALLATLVFALPAAAEDEPAPTNDRSKKLLEEFDANGDGKLDAEERKAAEAARGKRKGKRKGGEGKGERGKRGGDGKGKGEGRQRPSREEMLKKYDANGNGKLDPEERKKMHADRGGGEGGRKRGGDGEGRRKRGGDGERGRKGGGEGRKGGEGGRKRGGEGGEGRKRPSREDMLKKYDANGNGKLDPEELEKMRADRGGRRGGGGGRR